MTGRAEGGGAWISLRRGYRGELQDALGAGGDGNARDRVRA